MWLMFGSRLRAFLAASALTAILATGADAAAGSRVLPFISDDYTKAIAEARARKVPLFIESWAPW